MIRRLNFTGRRRIQRHRVTIRLYPGRPRSFDAEFDLDGLGFPDDANVFVESYNSHSHMRFWFGTVGKPRTPDETGLSDITRRPLPRFRLKIVDNSQRHGLLIGVADKLVPLRPEEDDEQRLSLLPVDFSDLGERVWRLDLSDWPVLELNRRIDGVAEAARSSGAFLGLVYPEVVRRVLHDIVIRQEVTDPDFDDSEWTSLWLRFAGELHGVGPPPAGVSEAAQTERLKWIEQAVEAFCRSHQARQRLEAAVDREINR